MKGKLGGLVVPKYDKISGAGGLSDLNKE